MTESTNEDKALVAYPSEFLRKFTGLSDEEAKALVELLTEATPKDIIKYRDIPGGKKAPYVPGPEFIKKFNQAFGFLWSFEIPDIKVDSDNKNLVAKGRWSLTFPGRTITRKHPDGMEETVRFDGFSVIKEQFGSSDVKRWTSDAPATDKKGRPIKKANGDQVYKHRVGDMLDLGNDYKAAATDAMKKCGMELGMFMDVYGPRDSDSEQSGPSDTQLQAFYFRAEKTSRNKDSADAYFLERTGKPIDQALDQEVLSMTADLIDEAKSKK